MQRFEKTIDVSKTLANYIDTLGDAVFFDIETTGLHHKYSYLYLIGILYQNESGWQLRQWFGAKPTDEPEILNAFINFIKPTNHLIHYNGGSFDLPYVRSRCAFYGIDTTPLDAIASLDLYRCIKPYQKKLGLDKLTQKSVEEFIGATRTDMYSGKELIDIYKEYLQTGDKILLNHLLLHNQEDVANMSTLISLMAYPFLFDGHYEITDVTLAANAFIVDLKLEYPIVHKLTYTSEIYSIALNHDTAKIKVPLYHGTLKHFYPNHKDYYYLPAEDKSIHKSVATYVDKEHRTPANAENCYQKITGTFIPQYDDIITPSFVVKRKDNISYFSCDDLDLPELSEWKPYINHLLQYK